MHPKNATSCNHPVGEPWPPILPSILAILWWNLQDVETKKGLGPRLPFLPPISGLLFWRWITASDAPHMEGEGFNPNLRHFATSAWFKKRVEIRGLGARAPGVPTCVHYCLRVCGTGTCKCAGCGYSLCTHCSLTDPPRVVGWTLDGSLRVIRPPPQMIHYFSSFQQKTQVNIYWWWVLKRGTYCDLWKHNTHSSCGRGGSCEILLPSLLSKFFFLFLFLFFKVVSGMRKCDCVDKKTELQRRVKRGISTVSTPPK